MSEFRPYRMRVADVDGSEAVYDLWALDESHAAQQAREAFTGLAHETGPLRTLHARLAVERLQEPIFPL